VTLLTDSIWIDFDGTPVTGVAPPRTIVHGERLLSKGQVGEARYHYKQFRAALKTSIAEYVVRERFFSDGTRMRMVSNNRVDTVDIWPLGGGIRILLPHGFAVVTAWSKPSIYGKATTGWNHYPDVIPQAKEDIKAWNTTELTAGGFKSIPMVRNTAKLWDIAKRSAHTFSTEDPMPVNLFVGTDPATKKLNPFDANVGVDDKVYNKDGTLLYTMPDSGFILGDETDHLKYNPPNTDTRGTVLCMQTYRYATISLIAEISMLRLCNERLSTPATNDVYVVDERNVVDFTVKTKENESITPVYKTEPTIDEKIDENKVYAFRLVPEAQSSMDVYRIYTDYAVWTSPYPIITVLWGIAEVPMDELSDFTQNAYYEKQQQLPDGERAVNKLVLLPQEEGAEYLIWYSRVSYPNDYYWRAGNAYRIMRNVGTDGYGSQYYSRKQYLIDRRNAEYTRLVKPTVRLDVKWIPAGYFILEGSGSGELLGRWCTNTYYGVSNINFAYNCYDVIPSTRPYALLAPDPSSGPIQPPWPNNQSFWMNAWAAAQATCIAPDLLAKKAAHSGNFTETIADLPLTNTINYTLKSRHIIDFDSRSQFLAAIRVEVTCTGAEWRAENTDRGHPAKITDPSYVARIYFESVWKDITSELLLATGNTASRPGFEFERISHENVYTWPSVVAYTEPTVYYMPPSLAPYIESALQLAELQRHQGANSHIVAEFTKEVPNVDEDGSKKGIEYSTYDTDGTRTPPRKYCQGMLYARTFKLSELSNALWLLDSTKCSAARNDTDGEAWYYMPALGVTINTQTFHIELRDGVLVNWSDDIPAKPGVTKPTGAARGPIDLFQV